MTKRKTPSGIRDRYDLCKRDKCQLRSKTPLSAARRIESPLTRQTIGSVVAVKAEANSTKIAAIWEDERDKEACRACSNSDKINSERFSATRTLRSETVERFGPQLSIVLLG